MGVFLGWTLFLEPFRVLIYMACPKYGVLLSLFMLLLAFHSKNIIWMLLAITSKYAHIQIYTNIQCHIHLHTYAHAHTRKYTYTHTHTSYEPTQDEKNISDKLDNQYISFQQRQYDEHNSYMISHIHIITQLLTADPHNKHMFHKYDTQ